jgi:DNA-3-methyladenine glycosylase I
LSEINERQIKRCDWAHSQSSDPLYIEYHDKEWGVPVHDDRKLFEFLILEGAQAGLSWLTVLRKREKLSAKPRWIRSEKSREVRLT